jgi:DnaJ-domain-containing protein 1
MSIGKRLLDLARSNLTDFRHAFDRDNLRDFLQSRGDDEPKPAEAEAESEESDDDRESVGAKAGRGARKVKDRAEDAWERAYDNARKRAGVRGDPPTDPGTQRRQWYKTLELEAGVDLKTVRRAYRKLLLKYHPDKFHNEPDKYKAATEVTRKLTEAYNGLTRYLGG